VDTPKQVIPQEIKSENYFLSYFRLMKEIYNVLVR